MAEKIATCCYCGTRAALVLRNEGRHELACRSCGAPLHEMKRLREGHPVDKSRAGPPRHRKAMTPPGLKPGKKRKSKSLKRKVLSEIFDVIDDIFD